MNVSESSAGGYLDISGNEKCRNDARYYYGTGDRLTTSRRAVLLRHFRPETPNGIGEQPPPLRIGTAALASRAASSRLAARPARLIPH
jgi:hypothetical protein